VDLRQEELEGSALYRMLMPGARRLGRTVNRVTPVDMHGRINHALILAGSPAGWDAERVVALKIIGAIACLVGSLLLVALLPISGWLKIFFVVLITYVGYLYPSMHVNSMAARRQRSIQKQLPDVMDLLTISVGGLEFDAALAGREERAGPLAGISRLLQDADRGEPGRCLRHG
jgi:tight adherence protein C